MKKQYILKNLIKIFITIILLVILFQKIEIEGFKDAINKIQPQSLCVAIILYLLSVEVTALKWKILLHTVRVSQLSKTCFKAQFYSTVLPGQIFGEASKIIDLRGSNESQGRVASSVIIDKITSLIGSTIIGIFGVLFTDIKIPNALRSLFAIILLLLLALMLSGRLRLLNSIVRYCCYYMWIGSLIKIRRFSKMIYKLYIIWEDYSSEGITLFKSVVAGIINQMLGVFMVWIVSNSMGLCVSIIEYCWIMPAVSVILLLPISFGGLGIREISLTGFLALFDVASEKALAISGIVLFSHIISAIIGAGVAGYDVIIKNFKNNGGNGK